jgi:Superinfection immunity protein/HIRAN domain
MEFGVGVVIFLALGYGLPTLIAGARGHANTGAIFVLNLLLGWTVLGWVAALVWSFTHQAPRVADGSNQHGRLEVEGRVLDKNTEIFASTKVVGVTFTNGDGKTRQSLIETMKEGQILALIADPKNVHDENAVGVFFKGDQIGTLDKETAKTYSALAQDRGHLFAVVQEITGGDADAGYPTLGVKIAIADA